ncbi:MAG: UDP-N-acetylglucosamine 2-epimerase (non-hydrolyzing) [Desulfovibrio sp.]|jgi:UDP-N-acetylglucosamine 2-epimerase (non-hydrolysing)|nr:UDP-N-acetylglucosamine 2-epimerase (non-hydrolyzing) [Desulfovibrio sp.]
MTKPKILSLVGARPQFIKEALIGEAVARGDAWKHIIVHSGQHYDPDMSDIFFQELQIPAPKYNLGVGSGTHGEITAAALIGIEKALLAECPDALLVYGDTNTTLAGALAAAKLHIPVVHVEAGIRMLPKSMPEEINRVLTDHVSAVLCCCSGLGARNLAGEGIWEGVFVTGDVMYDCFLRMRPQFFPEGACTKNHVRHDRFILATLHRDYNVDSGDSLRACLEGLDRLQTESGNRVLLPLHPRTKKRIEEFSCGDMAQQLVVTEPLGYPELMSLLESCAFVVTDSGGLQKEAYYAGKRAVVLMPDTGWRELTDCGWNILASRNADDIAAAGARATGRCIRPDCVYGSGDAAAKIVRAVRANL